MKSWLIWVGKTLPKVLDHLYSNADMKIQILKLHLRMFCAEIVERIFTSFHIFNYLG